MPWMAAAAIVGSSLIGAGSSYLGGQAQASADKNAAALSQQQYMQTRADFAPWRDSGVGALGQINALMGLPQTQAPANNNAFAQPQTAPSSSASGSGIGASQIAGGMLGGQLLEHGAGSFLTGGLFRKNSTPIQDIQRALSQGLPVSDASWAQAGLPPGGGPQFAAANPQLAPALGAQPGATAAQQPQGPDNSPQAIQARQQNAFAQFRTDPGYQFAFDQGQKALTNSAAAHGILNSGATGKALTDYGQGQADQQYGAYFNKLQSLAGLGQSATGSTAAAGGQAAGQSGNALMAGGNARASAYGGIADAANQGANNFAFNSYLSKMGNGTSFGGYTPPPLNSGAGSVGYF